MTINKYIYINHRMKNICLLACLVAALGAGAQKKKVDLLLFNAHIYTVDKGFSRATALAIDGGRIADVGTTQTLLRKYDPVQSVNVNGKYIYPGFIDAHTHFYRYGQMLQLAILVGTSSWDEVLQRLQAFAAAHPEGWIVGHGWDRTTGPLKNFPTRQGSTNCFPTGP